VSETAVSSRRRTSAEWLTEAWECFPAVAVLTLIVLWSEHDGGFDEDTWYWGALVLLVLLTAAALGAFGRLARPSRPVLIALGGFAVYTLWSYASMAWASYPGIALSGSNRTLLYLLVFTLLALMRWTPRRLQAALVAYALGIGAIAVLMLFQMAIGKGDASFFPQGRLNSPTGYFNSDAALFMMLALVSVGLSVRRELPSLLRGLLLALSAAGLQLALLGESRGWLFTLPLVLVLAVWASRDRLAIVVAAIPPTIALLVVLHRLLHVYTVGNAAVPVQRTVIAAAQHAGRASLVACAVVFVVGSVAAMLSPLFIKRRPRGRERVVLGWVLAGLAIVVCLVGADVATSGRPFHELKVQWTGFTHPARLETNGVGSHFATVGTQRYDAWRVAWDAFLAHPIGGLGQDNFADYYASRGRTGVAVEWTHSLEMRLLAHTGIVGTLAFLVFIVGALIGAIRIRRRGDPLARAMAGIALTPLIVWLVHGSLDWFWEIPALTGPSFAFLAAAGAMPTAEAAAEAPPQPRASLARGQVWAVRAVGAVAVAAAVVVLVFPYLSVREMSIGTNLRSTDPDAAFTAFRRAASLNPLNSDPGRFGGTLALQLGRWQEARRLYAQAIAREPDGWLAWFGSGLAASELGARRTARHDFTVARSLENAQPVIDVALKRVDSRHPLTAQSALGMFVIAG
jgi:O-Antigen ligase